jgi:hypothetical protein
MTYDDAPKPVQVADAGAAGWVAYSIAVWMAWVFLLGYVKPTAGIYMAGISVACLIAYTYAAVTQLKLGNLVGGVTWAYFGAFFAGASAFNYLIGWLAAKNGWAVDGRIQGWMWLVLGIVLIMETPIFMKYSNAAAWISIVGADVGIITLAIVFWGYGGTVMADISGWSFFVAGVGGILNAGSGILEGGGWKLPLGPPLFK